MYSAFENNNSLNNNHHHQHQHQNNSPSSLIKNNLNLNHNSNSKPPNFCSQSEKNILNDANGLWLNGSLSSSSMSASATITTGEDSLADPYSSTSTVTSGGASVTSNFNGNTYVRPNKKERKGLYFEHDQSQEEAKVPKPEMAVGSSSGSSSDAAGGGGSSHPGAPSPFSNSKSSNKGNKKSTSETSSSYEVDHPPSCVNGNMTAFASTTTPTDSSSTTLYNNKIPTLKFSSPTSVSNSSSSNTTTDEDTLEDCLNDSIENCSADPFSPISPSRRNFINNKLRASTPLKNTEFDNKFDSKDTSTKVLNCAREGGEEYHHDPEINNDLIIPFKVTGEVSSSSSEVGVVGVAVGDLLGINNMMKDDRLRISENSTTTTTNSFNNQNNQSHSLSTEENFECFGEGSESFSIVDSATESNSLQNFRDLNESDLHSSPGEGGGGGSEGNRKESLSRNAWQRTSLRRTPNNSNGEGMNNNNRRWGSFRSSTKRGVPVVPSSNALANQLYRSSSYHSSGRSSAGDGEEMYSDSSLEGEVIDLTKKVHHLEEKFTVLAENQNDVDDRYTRVKQENAELSTKLFMLEEQLRDVELRADDKVREEQRRHKEVIIRMDREKQLQIENYEIKSQMLEKDLSSSKIEVKRLEGALERERNEKNQYVDKCLHFEREISSLRDHNRELLAQNRVDRETMAMESQGSQQALVELKRQLESLSHFHMNGTSHSLRRIDSTDSECSELRSRLREAEEDIKRLKQLNNQLQETNEELSAQILNQGLEDGRNLLRNLNTSGGPTDGNSLAAEFEAMSNDEIKSALKDSKEANLALRAYIDGILLNIVEHYPQLLEVKNNKNNCNNNTSNGFNSSTITSAKNSK